MDTISFLRRVWPEDGYYCLAKPHPDGYFTHRSFGSIQEAHDAALAMDSMQFDVYFTIAALKQPKVFDPAKNDGKGGYRYRTKANISSLKAVFFEADVLRPDELEEASEAELARKYTSREEALSSTKKFCAQLGWPTPTVVSSGWGFHFYWMLDTAVDPAGYEVLVRKLKLLAKHFKYKLDQSALDISRVFRVPGTHNYKVADDPRPVRILKEGSARSYEELLAAVDRTLEERNIHVGDITPREHLPDYLNYGESNVLDGMEPAKLRPILKGCGAMREVVERPDEVAYHTWYRTLQVVRHCKNGEDLIHKVSALSSDYSEEETDKMIRSLTEKDIPPTLCDTFAKDSDACAACPHRHKIRTPATLGRPKSDVQQQTTLALQAAVGAIPPPPFPYTIDPAQGVWEQVKDKEDVIDMLILHYPLQPVGRAVSDFEGGEDMMIWETATPCDGVQRVKMQTSTLLNRMKFVEVLGSAGIVLELDMVPRVQKYMARYQRLVQQMLPRQLEYVQMGWVKAGDKFILDNRELSVTGEKDCLTQNRNRVVRAAVCEGDLSKWQAAANHFITEGFAPHYFALLVGFAAPLFRFTSQVGGVVNMLGRSGAGKSTMQKVVNSIWGHPTHLMLPADSKSSTFNAKISVLNMMNSLPVCAEEITQANQQEVGDLAFTVSLGIEKLRANRDGEVRDEKGGWRTIMLSSSNTSLIELVHGSAGGEAKAFRIFEYELPFVDAYSPAYFRTAVEDVITENYGVAGKQYIKHVLANQDRVKALVKTKVTEAESRFSLDKDERIYAAIIGTVCAAQQLVSESGVLGVANGLEKFIEGALSRLRDSAAEARTSAIDILGDYLADSTRNMLVMDGDKTGEFPIQEPMGALNIRYERHRGEIALSIKPFKDYCLERHFQGGYQEILRDLRSLKVMRPGYHRRTLAKGTKLAGTQSRVLLVDAEASAFSGSLKAVVTQIDISNTDPQFNRGER